MTSFEESFEEKMINNEISSLQNKGNISDGYHTFDELYEHRFALFIALCKSTKEIKRIATYGNVVSEVWRSMIHSDGSNFDRWFILGIGKEKGEQITYHLPISKWDSCNFAETLDKAPKFDGHTSNDVLERIKELF